MGHPTVQATSCGSLDKTELFSALGLSSPSEEQKGIYDGSWKAGNGSTVFTSVCPATGIEVGKVRSATVDDVASVLSVMQSASTEWKEFPAPKRGEIVKEIGDAISANLETLAYLLTLENGKLLTEAKGEITEVVHLCDLANGLSRQLEGKVLPSERFGHSILERWQPLGCIGVITAFNFPVAVLGWNLGLAMICGDCTMWKGSEATPNVSIALSKIIATVLEKNKVPKGVFTLVTGGGDVGQAMVDSPALQLISFTGSCKRGRAVAQAVSSRFGKCILELGGNNASVVMPDADMSLVIRGSLFGAIGTAGQRCTALRRLLIHESCYDDVVKRLKKAYASVKVGDPLNPQTLCGPLHTEVAIQAYENALVAIQKEGGEILCGGKRYTPTSEDNKKGYFVEPTIVEMKNEKAKCLQEEVFAPILYVVKIKDLQHGIDMNNGVPQGLSSSIFTKDIQNIFKWIGPTGSDCGIVNVNIGTSGAEIGGAFGGEKATGGGREAGSDAWKQYCRRTTCTINYSTALPLAQGVNFDVEDA